MWLCLSVLLLDTPFILAFTRNTFYISRHLDRLRDHTYASMRLSLKAVVLRA